MQLRRILIDLAHEIADQADRDPEFAARVSRALRMVEHSLERRQAGTTVGLLGHEMEARRPKNRRPPAVVDPIALARDGEGVLRARLSELSLDQLKDVVADYGMDVGKLVMKWKSPEKVINRIVEIAVARAQKGDAFRAE